MIVGRPNSPGLAKLSHTSISPLIGQASPVLYPPTPINHSSGHNPRVLSGANRHSTAYVPPVVVVNALLLMISAVR